MCIPSFLAYYATALPAKLSTCRPLKRCMLVIAIVIKSRGPTQKGWISATYWNPLVIPPGLPQLNPRNPLQSLLGRVTGS